MAGKNYFRRLDLCGVDIQVRNVLGKMRIETVGELLELEERDFSGLKNCGSKTSARILLLQAKYGKDVTAAKPREGVDEVLANSMRYASGLIAVVRAANEVIDGAKKDERSRYYFCVPTKCFNGLRRTLEALGKL